MLNELIRTRNFDLNELNLKNRTQSRACQNSKDCLFQDLKGFRYSCIETLLNMKNIMIRYQVQTNLHSYTEQLKPINLMIQMNS